MVVTAKMMTAMVMATEPKGLSFPRSAFRAGVIPQLPVKNVARTSCLQAGRPALPHATKAFRARINSPCFSTANGVGFLRKEESSYAGTRIRYQTLR